MGLDSMNWLNTILILLAALLCVFLQAVEGGVRYWLGTQVNLLPGLVVYASLRGNLATTALPMACIRCVLPRPVLP